MKMNFICKNENELNSIAAEILSAYTDERIFAFFGEMGVGKTTLIKQICKVLGTADNVCSPTFAIVNEYHLPQDGNIYHFDFYRLKNLNEAYDMGYEEYFYSGAYCLIEWSEKVESILPPGYLRVEMETLSNGERKINVTKA